jgi:hypothetical protein
VTLIVGVNTSNAIYLASDTRVTIGPKGGPFTYQNDLQKTVPLTENIAIAAAGNVRMAGYLTSSIGADPVCATGDIRALRDRAVDIVRATADRYFRAMPDDPDPRCALLIAGTGPRLEKSVRTRGRIPAILAAAQRWKEETIARLEEGVERATTAEGRMGALRLLAEHSASGLRPNEPFGRVLGNALFGPDKDGVTTLPCRDSHLFSIEIDPRMLREQDAEWGEGLIFGGDESIRKDVAPDDLIAAIEFSDPTTAPVHLTASILQTAKDHGAATIGGGVMVTMVGDRGLAYWGGWTKKLNPTLDGTEDYPEIVVDGLQLSIRDGGDLKSLVPFHRWPFRDQRALARA